MTTPSLKTVYVNKTAEEILAGEPIGDLQYITKDFILVKEELIVFTPAEYEAYNKSIVPEFIKRMDWELLRQQKEWLLNNDVCDEALGIIHLIDAVQDYAVDDCGIDENEVFNKPTRKFKLISNPDGVWFEGDEDGDQTPMKIGRIIYDDEILNGEPFSYWYEGQEKYFEEVVDVEYNTIIEDQLNDNPVSPEIDRLVDLTIDFFNALEVNYKGWPKEAKKIVRKRGGIELLRIKDLIKIEQILGYQIIKIEKL